MRLLTTAIGRPPRRLALADSTLWSGWCQKQNGWSRMGVARQVERSRVRAEQVGGLATPSNGYLCREKWKVGVLWSVTTTEV